MAKLALSAHQVRTLSMLIASAKPSARGMGVRVASLESLRRAWLIDFRWPQVDRVVTPNAEMRITPTGFRAWAYIIGKVGETQASTNGIRIPREALR